jgi:polyisoprenyl-phosphate glycosyltransferase
MPRTSVITAFLNEEANLPLFRERVVAILDRLGEACEIVMVDDHSQDSGPAIVKDWLANDRRVRYIRLARTSGSHAAYSAGLAKATGDAVVLLAADLQDPPELIPDLLAKWREGYHVVWASRAQRQGETWLTRRLSNTYYWLMRRLALPQMPAQGADFLLMDRKVVDAYNSIPEKNTSFLAMIMWMGFRQTFIEYVKQARHAGVSKWNLSKKIKLFIDSLVSFSYAPIRLMSAIGVGASLLGMLYAAVVVVNALRGDPVNGWSSIMVVVLLLGGFQMVMLGMLGEYLWRAFDEARGRPRYLIEEEIAADHEAGDSKRSAA